MTEQLRLLARATPLNHSSGLFSRPIGRMVNYACSPSSPPGSSTIASIIAKPWALGIGTRLPFTGAAGVGESGGNRLRSSNEG